VVPMGAVVEIDEGAKVRAQHGLVALRLQGSMVLRFLGFGGDIMVRDVPEWYDRETEVFARLACVESYLTAGYSLHSLPALYVKSWLDKVQAPACVCDVGRVKVVQGAVDLGSQLDSGERVLAVAYHQVSCTRSGAALDATSVIVGERFYGMLVLVGGSMEDVELVGPYASVEARQTVFLEAKYQGPQCVCGGVRVPGSMKMGVKKLRSGVSLLRHAYANCLTRDT